MRGPRKSFIFLRRSEGPLLQVAGVRLIPGCCIVSNAGLAIRILFCLAPHRVYHAVAVTCGPGELLPRLFTLTRQAWRFVFCDTFRELPLTGKSPVHSTRCAAMWCPDFPPPVARERLPARQSHPILSLLICKLTSGFNLPFTRWR